MRVVTYSFFRQNLKKEMRRCLDDADTLLVTNKNEEENVVVMNAADYEALMETISIYENPYLYDKILCGIAEIDAGGGSEKELIDI